MFISSLTRAGALASGASFVRSQRAGQHGQGLGLAFAEMDDHLERGMRSWVRERVRHDGTQWQTTSAATRLTLPSSKPGSMRSR